MSDSPNSSHQERLRRISFFSNLPQEMLEALAARLSRQHHKQGEIVFAEGSVGDSLYFIETGQVKVSVGSSPNERILNYLGPGNFFGELAIFLDQRRTATISVVIDADFWVLRKSDLDDLLQKYPENALQISRELSRRLTDTIRKPTREERYKLVAVVGQAPWHLARYLVSLTGGWVVLLNLTGTELASRIDESLPHQVVIQDLPSDVTATAMTERLGVLADSYERVILYVEPENREIAVRAAQLAEVVVSISEVPPGGEDAIRGMRARSGQARPEWLSGELALKPVWNISDTPREVERIARRLAQRVVGLALSSGGARGLAHVGVLKVLDQEGIAIDMLAGTSAGSLFGGLYAAGIPIDSIVELALGFYKEISMRALLDFNIPPKTGLLRGRRFLNFLDRLFGGIQFEDLENPFFVVSADALTGEEIVFEKGPVADAVRASTSIVGIMSPHEYQGRQLIDGGAVNPLPVSVLARKGSDIIIASRAIPTLEDELASKRSTRSVKSLNIMGLLGNTQSIMEREIMKTRLDLIDVLIYPRVEAYTSMEYRQAAQLIRLGEESAQQAIPIIKEKLTPTSG